MPECIPERDAGSQFLHTERRLLLRGALCKVLIQVMNREIILNDIPEEFKRDIFYFPPYSSKKKKENKKEVEDERNANF